MSHESDAQKSLRRNRIDDPTGDPVAYLDETGTTIPWSGDDEAPYVKVLQSDNDEALRVQGDIAANAVDSGNPIKIGGLARAVATLPTAVSAADRVNALFDIYGRLGIIPWAAETDEVILVADAALAAAGAFTRSSVFDTRGYRRLNLTIRYAPGAVGGYPHIVPVRAKTAAQPPVNGDDWSAFSVNDATVTAANLAGALPGGTIFTAQPTWGEVTQYPLVLRTIATTLAGQVIRLDVEIDISSVKWVYIDYAERGVVGTPGTLGLRYNLSMG